MLLNLSKKTTPLVGFS